MTTTLTARGRGLLRLASFASILVLLFALFGTKAEGATQASGSSGSSGSGNYQQITVVPGETLWQIASMVRTASGFQGDLRDLIDQIISLNGLSSPAISAGSHLTIPLSK